MTDKSKYIIIILLMVIPLFIFSYYFSDWNNEQIWNSINNTQGLWWSWNLVNSISYVHKRVSINEFKVELLDNNSELIDIRSIWELKDTWIIEWAKNIDYYNINFKNNLNKLDKNKKYLIYCRSWNRSWYTLSIMKDLGFINVIELNWWIINWLDWWEKLVKFK